MMTKKTKIFNLAQITRQDKEYIAAALLNGKTAILPTDTVYGLTVFAKREFLPALNEAKNNPQDKPAQILCSKHTAQKLALPSKGLEKALNIWPAALTAVLAATPCGKALSGLDTVGLRVPDSSFLADIFKLCGGALYASSANLHNLPNLEKQADITKVFTGRVDIIVTDGDLYAKPSAVIDFTVLPPKIIRKGLLTEKIL